MARDAGAQVLTSPERAHFLRESTDVAQLILVGTVRSVGDPTPREDTYVYSDVTLHVDRCLKSLRPPDSLVTFAAQQYVSNAWRFDVGSQYLVFLAKCPCLPILKSVAEYSTAQISGAAVRIQNPPTTESSSALLDSVLTFLQAQAPGAVAATASTVVLGDLIDYQSGSVDKYFKKGTFRLVTRAVHKDASGAAVVVGDSLTVSFGTPVTAYSQLDGTMPPLSVGDHALFFLQRGGGQWSLAPSLYARWRVDGDSAFAEAEPLGCRLRAVIVRAMASADVVHDVNQ